MCRMANLTNREAIEAVRNLCQSEFLPICTPVFVANRTDVCFVLMTNEDFSEDIILVIWKSPDGKIKQKEALRGCVTINDLPTEKDGKIRLNLVGFGRSDVTKEFLVSDFGLESVKC